MYTVSETVRYDIASEITRCPHATPLYRLTHRSPGDPISNVSDQADVGLGLIIRAERVLLDWMPVNSRSDAVPLDISVRQ